MSQLLDLQEMEAEMDLDEEEEGQQETMLPPPDY